MDLRGFSYDYAFMNIGRNFEPVGIFDHDYIFPFETTYYAAPCRIEEAHFISYFYIHIAISFPQKYEFIFGNEAGRSEKAR